MLKSHLASPNANSSPLSPGARFAASIADQQHYAASSILNDGQYHALVLFDRRIDSAKLNQALRLVIDEEPCLGCLFVPDETTPYWERRSDLDAQHVWTVHIESGLLPPEARPGVYRFVTSPRDAAKHPIIEGRLFRSSTDMFCLKVHHAATDANGLRYLLYRIAAHYRALTSNAGSGEPLTTHNPSERDITRLLDFVPLTSESLAPPPASNSITPGAWGFPARAIQNHSQPAYIVQKVPLMVVKSMKAYASRANMSIDEILLTTFWRSLVEVLAADPDSLRLLARLIDLRRNFPERYQSSIGNLTVQAVLDLSAPGPNYQWRSAYGDRTFNELLRQVRQAIEAQDNTQPWLRDLVLGRQQTFAQIRQAVNAAREAELNTSTAPPLVANLGMYDARKLDFGAARVVDTYTLSPTQYAPRFMLACSWFMDSNGQISLTLSANFCEDAVESAKVERVLAGMVGRLAEF